MTQKLGIDIFSGNILNIAAICPETQALGPGTRAVIWVQGCPFHCQGCIAPDWIDPRPNILKTPEELVDQLLSNPNITGLTFSGGEPMAQAAGLARVAELTKERKDINIISFTGYKLPYLKRKPPNPGVNRLLESIDVLIDGQYVENLNDNQGLRGSSNQKIHYLTDRLRNKDLENTIRKSEIHVLDGQVMLVGIPPKGLRLAFDNAIQASKSMKFELVNYERS